MTYNFSKLIDALTIPIISTVFLDSLHNSHFYSFHQVSWCVSLVFSRYFHLATFFWMFVEGTGIYLCTNFD